MRRVARMLLAIGLAALPCAAGAVQPSIIVHKLQIDIAVRPDGSATAVRHQEQSPASEAAASSIGQFPIGFNPSLERIEIGEAYTRKADGRSLPVDLAATRTTLAPGVPNVPIFQDVQQKVVVFPDLGTGDTTVITYTELIDHPLFPGAFIWAMYLSPTMSWEDVEVTVTAPASYPLRTETFGMDYSSAPAEDGQVRHHWHYRATDVVAEDLAAVSPWDRLPRFTISSFADYGAMARAYAERAEPQSAVTPAIRERAEAITSGVSDRRTQAKLIYAWVSKHIRYVALYLAAGGVVPHDADAVLAAGYGDCKDHVALYAALLKARGIDSRGVLVNLGDSYTLSGPPSMAQLNHIITYLPEFDVYADTTAGVAPFGTLPFLEYGKPAVMVGGDGKAEIRLGLVATEANTIITRTDEKLAADGSISGATRTVATGPASIMLRLAARWAQANGNEGAARRQLDALGQPGTGIFRFSPPDDVDDSYTLSGRFTLDARPEYLEGDSFAPALGLPALPRPGDFLLGPLRRTTLPVSEPTPCFSGRDDELIALEIPAGFEVQHLPKDRRIAADGFVYTSHWSQEGRIVTVRRELESRIDTPLCSGARRQAVAAAMVDIRRDHRAKIAVDAP